MLAGFHNAYDYLFGFYYEKILINAALNGNIDEVQNALFKGASLNYQENNTLDSALHKAAFIGHTPIVKLLLKKESIEVNQVNARNETPLHKAAINGHTGCILLLISNGAKLNALNDKQLSALDLLIKNRKNETLKQLILHSKSVDNTQYNNLIARMLTFEQIDMAIDFIDSVPDPIQINKDSLLEFAVKQQNEQIVTTLLDKFYDTQEPELNKLLNIAVSLNNRPIVHLLLSKGACANNESTPILFAAQNGYANIIETLQKAGAILSVHNIDGNNVLHLTIIGMHLEAFKVLVTKSINLDEPNFAGLTPNQLLTKNIEELRKTLSSLRQEFINKVKNAALTLKDSGFIKRTLRFNKNQLEFSSSMNALSETLSKEEQAIADKMEIFNEMQALLNSAKTFKVAFNRPMSPLALMPPKSTHPLDKPIINRPSSSPTVVLKKSNALTPAADLERERVVGAKTPRPADFDNDEEPDLKRLKTSG